MYSFGQDHYLTTNSGTPTNRLTINTGEIIFGGPIFGSDATMTNVSADLVNVGTSQIYESSPANLVIQNSGGTILLSSDLIGMSAITGNNLDGANVIYPGNGGSPMEFYAYGSNSIFHQNVTVTINGGELYGGGQVEDFNVNDNTEDSYLNLAHFNVNYPGARGSIVLSADDGNDWVNNFLQYAVHGTEYPFNYYLTDRPGKTSDAGWDLIWGQGVNVQGLGILTYNSAPISIGTNNKERIGIATDGFITFRSSASYSGSVIVNSSMTVTKQFYASSVTAVSGDIGFPYGSFSSTNTQTIAATNIAYPIYFDIVESTGAGIYWINTKKSTVTVQLAGAYLITFSAIEDITGGANVDYEIWLRVNGIDKARTNTITHIVNPSAEQVVTVSYLQRFNAGDNVQLMMRAASTSAQLLYTAAGTSPTRPESPSIIMTINKISK
jgi:hypothetical protein